MTHTQTVTTINNLWSNPSPLGDRWPFSLARLTCGHSLKVELLKKTYRCHKCNTEYTEDETLPWLKRGKCPACGCGVSKPGFDPDPHNPSHQLTRIGDIVKCAKCEQEAVDFKKFTCLDWSTVAYTRVRHDGFENMIHAYLRDTRSPTGVSGSVVVRATDEVYAWLRANGHGSPLSPTERA